MQHPHEARYGVKVAGVRDLAPWGPQDEFSRAMNEKVGKYMPIGGGAGAATLVRGRGEGESPAAGAAPVPRVPFIRAAHRHVEPVFDVTQAIGANAIALGPFDVPAYGFIRNILLLVEGTGGVIGTGVLAADYPWSILREVSLIDVNGAPIVFPVTGYQTYLMNKYGGYVWSSDPTAAPDYDATIGTPRIMLRIPVEITPWDGFGALANQNAAAAYKVRLTLGANTDILSTVGTATPPTIRIRGFLEAYSQPPDVDLLNQPQETVPPGHGTTQYWSVNAPAVSAGQQTVRLVRVGNLIRNIVFVVRDAAGLRVTVANTPDPLTINWDNRQLVANEPLRYRRLKMLEQFNYAPEAGVLVYAFTDDQDGHAGYENRHLWVPTVQSTRLELNASFPVAGTLQVLTNDVAVTALGR